MHNDLIDLSFATTILGCLGFFCLGLLPGVQTMCAEETPLTPLTPVIGLEFECLDLETGEECSDEDFTRSPYQ